MFVFVDFVEVDAEERVWEPSGNGRIAEVKVDNVCCKEGQKSVIACWDSAE